MAHKTDETDITEIRRQYGKIIQAQNIIEPIRLQWRDTRARDMSSVSNSPLTTQAEQATVLNEKEEETGPPAATSEVSHQLGVTFCNVLGILALVSFTAVLYMWRQGYDQSDPQRPFNGSSSIIDGFYWCSTTISSVGFGDIIPQNLEGKLGTCLLIIIGLPILTYVCQTLNEFCTYWEESLISWLYANWPQNSVAKCLHGSNYTKRGRRVDTRLHQIKVRWFLSAFYSALWMLAGVCIFALEDHMSLGEAFYATVISQSTVGYGDKPFHTDAAKMLSSFWMIMAPSTLNRVFEIQIEARLHMRSKRIIFKEPTDLEIQAARNLSELDFIIRKLKEAHKTDDKDIVEINSQYRRLIEVQNSMQAVRYIWSYKSQVQGEEHV